MKRLALVGAVVLTMHVTACTDAPVAGPEPTAPRFASAYGADLTTLAKYKPGKQPALPFTMAVVGYWGGTVRHGDFAVVIPQGALLLPTVITITVPVQSDLSNYVLAQFGPHGIRFRKPVTLRLPLAGTSSEDQAAPRVLWFNGFDWTPLPTTTTTDGKVEAQTDHFSEYGTEDPSRGITLAGG